MELGDGQIKLEELERWQKIEMPAEQNRLLFFLYSFFMLVWLAMFLFILQALFRPFAVPGLALGSLVWRLLLLVWLIVWLWFGRRWLWRYWQTYAARREILFINEQELIVRRPLSILGVTDSYDMAHISGLYMDRTSLCPAFDYGVRSVRLGRGLSPAAGRELVALLNHRYFPGFAAGDEA